jgi:hypothetical protein
MWRWGSFDGKSEFCELRTSLAAQKAFLRWRCDLDATATVSNVKTIIAVEWRILECMHRFTLESDASVVHYPSYCIGGDYSVL